MTELILAVFGSFIAIIGFAVLVETPRKYVLQAGGGVYFFSSQSGLDVVTASFLSALAMSLLAHIFARIFKAPVTVFLIAGILPTVPGAGMYRTVYYIIADDRTHAAYYLVQTLEMAYYLVQTLEIAGVIALAIFIMDALFRLRPRKDVSRPGVSGR